MPSARSEVVIDVPPDRFWDVLVDWERYPEFLPELKEIHVHVAEHDRYEVSYVVSLIKQIRYKLRFRAESSRLLTWDMAESNLLTKNSGAWRLAAEGPDGARTRASYEVDIEVGAYVPRAILTKLVTVSLPRMLAQFKQRAEISSR